MYFAAIVGTTVVWPSSWWQVPANHQRHVTGGFPVRLIEEHKLPTTTDITVVVVPAETVSLTHKKLTVRYRLFTLFSVDSLLGEGCLDKPLATLWKNYCQSSRPDVSMRLSVCSSGLQVNAAFTTLCQKVHFSFVFFSFSHVEIITSLVNRLNQSSFEALLRPRGASLGQCQRLSLWLAAWGGNTHSKGSWRAQPPCDWMLIGVSQFPNCFPLPYFVLLGNNVWARADGVLVSPRDVVLGSAFLPAHLRLGLSSWRTPSQSKQRLHHEIIIFRLDPTINVWCKFSLFLFFFFFGLLSPCCYRIAARVAVSRCVVHDGSTSSTTNGPAGAATPRGSARFQTRETVPTIGPSFGGCLSLRWLFQRHSKAKTSACARNQQLQVLDLNFTVLLLLLLKRLLLDRPPVERCKSAPKLGSIEESPELEEVEEKDWLRVLALRGTHSAPTLQRNNTVIKPVSPSRSSLETVREEERFISTPSLPIKMIAESDPSPDAVSPDGLLVRNLRRRPLRSKLGGIVTCCSFLQKGFGRGEGDSDARWRHFLCRRRSCQSSPIQWVIVLSRGQTDPASLAEANERRGSQEIRIGRLRHRQRRKTVIAAAHSTTSSPSLAPLQSRQRQRLRGRAPTATESGPHPPAKSTGIRRRCSVSFSSGR